MAKFGNNAASPPPCQPCKEQPVESERHWIEIELVYEDDESPAPYREYCITLPDGTEVRGSLDKYGKAKISFLDDPGQAKVTFPTIHKDLVRPA